MIDLRKNFALSLDSVWVAEELFEKINNQEDEEVTLNFEDIQFISLSFSQAYVNFKRHSPKTIKEINLSRENRIMLQVVADKFNMKIG
ncbi:MAG: hypothetical protein BZ135_04785 [Methanosphaera sp. rholeuAM6]|nr:MAG: hypothetical protein BZ135_04785 [Methanosphaera sp. rholeuAM6]